MGGHLAIRTVGDHSHTAFTSYKPKLQDVAVYVKHAHTQLYASNADSLLRGIGLSFL